MKFAILALVTVTTATASSPCERLCILDTAAVCTGGSWPKAGGICHAYFLLPSGEHCYHNAATSAVCHDRLPPLTVDEAAFFVAALTSESTSSSTTTRATITTTTRPTTTTTTRTTTTSTTTRTTTTSTTTRPTTTTTTRTTTAPRTTTTTTRSTTTTTTPRTTTATTTIPATTVAAVEERRRRVIPLNAVPPTTTTTATTTIPATTVAAVEERRRRVIPLNAVPPTTTTTTNIPPTPEAVPERRRRVIPVTQVTPTPSIPTAADEDSVTVPPATERRRRVIPIGSDGAHTPTQPVARSLDPAFRAAAAAGPPSAMLTPQRSPVSRFTPGLAPPTFGGMGTSVDASEDLVYGDGPNSIGRAVAAATAGGSWPAVVDAIAAGLSRPSAAAISGDDFIFLWVRSQGATLLERAKAEGAEQCRLASRYQNACFALMLLVGEMPLPANLQDRLGAIQLLGVSEFVAEHMEALRGLLQISITDDSLNSFYMDGGRMDVMPRAIMGGFAANWIDRFPTLVDNAARRGIVLKHRLYRYMFLNDRSYHGALHFETQRNHTFAESYEQLATAHPAQVRRGVGRARFRGEGAVGVGVVREWYSAISYDVYASDYALFERRQEAPIFYQISEFAHLHTRDRFIAIGRFMAMSIAQGIPIGVNMNHMFYKRLLGEALVLADVESVNPESFRSMQYVMGLESDEDLEEQINAPMPMSGTEAIVTLENRDTQLAAALDNLSTNGMVDQFGWFAQGFFGVIPRELFDGITANDLGAILFGDDNIDVDDLVRNMVVEGYSRDSPPVQYLIQVLREMNQEQRRGFLKFTTSNTQLPLGGFASLHPGFKISRTYKSAEHLPETHTCFNTIDLPQYTSLEQTRQKLTLAIEQSNQRMENY